jgi:predicted glutamine amidotransferase
MCVAIIKPANFTFDAIDVEDFYHQNSDGFGVMWAQDGVIHAHRALPKSAKDAVKLYQKLVPHDRECVLHYRFATHGSKTLKNTHPFAITDDLYMVHNGVLSEHSLGLKCGKGTDTTAYVRQYLTPMLAKAKDPLELAHCPEFRAVIGEHIGHSKFVFLDKHGTISVVNKELGKVITRSGIKIWVSNTNWDTSAYYRTPAPTGPAKQVNHTTRLSYDWGKPELLVWDDEEDDIAPGDVTLFLEAVDQAFAVHDAFVESYLDEASLIEYFTDPDVGGEDAWAVVDYLKTGAIDLDTFTDIAIGAAVLDLEDAA